MLYQIQSLTILLWTICEIDNPSTIHDLIIDRF